MKKLTINRQEWLRGERGGFLLRPSDHKRCCLGIFARQLGIPDNELSCIETLDEVHDWDNVVPAWATISETISPFYQVNDQVDITEDAREEVLTELFADQGIEVEFVG